jgi:hypothetical protein
MPDFKPGDRVVVYQAHPVEGLLGAVLGETLTIDRFGFTHHGEKYWYCVRENKIVLGVLETMIQPENLSPFDKLVHDYIRSELKT